MIFVVYSNNNIHRHKPYSACSRAFAGDIYGDHVVSCVGIIDIKHRHNVVRDTLVDICYRSGISAGKEVDIGLNGGRDKPLPPADMLLYSWDGGLDVCVDLTGSSPLTQTAMVDFVPGRAVIDAAQRKRGKYMDRCAAIGYGFLLFSFSSLGEFEADVITLLKRIWNFSITHWGTAPFTPLVKSGGGIRPIVVGLVWRHLVFKVSAVMIGHSLNDYLNDLKFGVVASGGSEDILHVVNRLCRIPINTYTSYHTRIYIKKIEMR
ncbi:hypothetical protein Tco_1015722 [Tanacetum coccineum]|uniref:Uncharacterized protein n=1 Tax=Tanacetum coccineum TaxID=301880 RepID=A0ABQ5FNG8_9ASTR